MAGLARDGLDQLLAGQLRRQRQGRLEPPAQVADRHPRPAAPPGPRGPPPRSTSPTGVPSPSTTTRPRAPAASARRSASASGRSTVTGMARRVRARADRPGSRCCTARPGRGLAGAGPDERRRAAPPQIDVDEVGSRPSSGGHAGTARRGRPTATPRPAQPATTVPVCAAAGDPPDRGGQHPAAVQRQAGQQVEHADEQVAQHQGSGQQAADRARVEQLGRPRRPAPPSSSETSGPATAIRPPGPGCRPAARSRTRRPAGTG